VVAALIIDSESERKLAQTAPPGFVNPDNAQHAAERKELNNAPELRTSEPSNQAATRVHDD